MIFKSLQKAFFLSSLLSTFSLASESLPDSYPQLIPHLASTREVIKYETKSPNFDCVRFNKHIPEEELAIADRMLFGNVAYGMVEGIVTGVTTNIKTLFIHTIRTKGVQGLASVASQLCSLSNNMTEKTVINTSVSTIINLLTSNIKPNHQIKAIAKELGIISRIICQHTAQNINSTDLKKTTDIFTSITYDYAYKQMRETFVSLLASNDGNHKRISNAIQNNQMLSGNDSIIQTLNIAFKAMRSEILNHSTLSHLQVWSKIQLPVFLEHVINQRKLNLNEIQQLRMKTAKKIETNTTQTTQAINARRLLGGDNTQQKEDVPLETSLMTMSMGYAAAEEAKINIYELGCTAWSLHKGNTDLNADRKAAIRLLRSATTKLVSNALTTSKTPITARAYEPNPFAINNVGNLARVVHTAFYNNTYHIRDISLITAATLTGFLQPDILNVVWNIWR